MAEVLQISAAQWQFLKLQTRYNIHLASQKFNLTIQSQIATIEQYAMRAFSSALDAVPLALAENSGLSPIETLTDVKSRQINEKNSRLGIDCNGRGENGILFPVRWNLT
jgi:chaperonin GroEL (HSP60 family)